MSKIKLKWSNIQGKLSSYSIKRTLGLYINTDLCVGDTESVELENRLQLMFLKSNVSYRSF